MTSLCVSAGRMGRGLLETLVAVAMLFGFAAVAHCNQGCGVQDAQGPNTKEQAYTAAIVGCAAKAKTKAEDHACRVLVNKQYGLCEGTGPYAGALPGDCE